MNMNFISNQIKIVDNKKKTTTIANEIIKSDDPNCYLFIHIKTKKA
jgi:hypothetical protein